METNRIRQFCVIAETENIRKAAESLNMTHGALSKSMQVLSQELDIILFTKIGRGIGLTEEGRTFHSKSITFLESLDRLLSEDKKKEESITIGSFEVFTTHFFTNKILPEFPETKFRLKEYMPGELENAILNNKVDIGITYELIPKQGVDALYIGNCEMGLYGRKDMFEKHTIETVPFVAPIEPVNSMISGVKGLDGWPDGKLKRNRYFEVDMLETALQLSSQGKAIGLYPKFLIEIFNSTKIKKFQLEKLPTPKAAKNIKRKVYLLVKQGNQETKEIKRIAKIIRNTVTSIS